MIPIRFTIFALHCLISSYHFVFGLGESSKLDLNPHLNPFQKCNLLLLLNHVNDPRKQNSHIDTSHYGKNSSELDKDFFEEDSSRNATTSNYGNNSSEPEQDLLEDDDSWRLTPNYNYWQGSYELEEVEVPITLIKIEYTSLGSQQDPERLLEDNVHFCNDTAYEISSEKRLRFLNHKLNCIAALYIP